MISREYIAWLDEIKSRIRSARVSAPWSVNRELILLCDKLSQNWMRAEKNS